MGVRGRKAGIPTARLAFRVPLDLLPGLYALAESRSCCLTDVVLDALRDYVASRALPPGARVVQYPDDPDHPCIVVTPDGLTVGCEDEAQAQAVLRSLLGR